MLQRQYGFPRSLRLTKTDEYSSVFAFRKIIRGKWLSFYQGSSIPPVDQQEPRIGIVVPKQCVKKAVCRNRLKRIVRETFRLRKHFLPSLDFVIRANRKIAGVIPHGEVMQDLDLFFRQSAANKSKLL